MDLLGGMSRDELRILSWVAAAGFALVAGVWRPRRLHWVKLTAARAAGALPVYGGTPGYAPHLYGSKLECTTAGWDHRRAHCSRAAALAYCTHA